MRFFLITIIMGIIFFITVIIYASFPYEKCTYFMFYGGSDFSDCWKRLPMHVMALFVLPSYGIFYICYRIKNRINRN